MILKNRGWLVTAAGVGINLALGVLYTWSVLKTAIRAELGLTDFQASLPYAVATAAIGIMMAPAGRMQDRLGPRVVATIGGVLVGSGLILSSFATSLTVLIVGFGVLVGGGIGVGYAATTPAAVKWFPTSKKGLIIGIVVAGFGLAPVYITPLAKAMLAGIGLKGTLLILGIAFLVMTVVLAQLLIAPPPGYVPAGAAPAPAAAAAAAPAPAKVDYEWHETLKTPQFYLLWVMYAVGATGGLMMIGHLASFAKSIGVDAGFFMVALLAVFNALGRISAGVVSDKIGRTRALQFFYVVQAVTLLSLPVMKGFLLLAIATAIIGSCYGAYMAIFPGITFDYFGIKNGGLNYGMLFSAWGIAGVFGAPLAGYLKDVTGSYISAFQIAAGLIVIGIVLTFVTKAPRAKALAQAGTAAD